MTRKLSAGIGTLFGTAFTSVAAPVLVTLITQAVKIEENTTAPSKEARIVVEGIGRTPEEAVSNGLRDAVRAVALSLQTEQGSPRTQIPLQAVLPESKDVVLRWEERGGRVEAWPDGLIHRKDLVVVVDRVALAQRLKRFAVSPHQEGCAGSPAIAHRH